MGITLELDRQILDLKNRDKIIIGRKGEFFHISDFTVSRKHFKLEKEKDTYRIFDLGSRSGTYVNGIKVEEEGILLPEFAYIRCGKTVFKFINIPDLKFKFSSETDSIIFGIPEKISTKKIIDTNGPLVTLLYLISSLLQEKRWKDEQVKLEILKLIATYLSAQNVILLSSSIESKDYKIISYFSSLKDKNKREEVIIYEEIIKKCIKSSSALTAKINDLNILCVSINTHPQNFLIYIERKDKHAFYNNEIMIIAAIAKLINFAYKEQQLKQQIERSQKLEMIGTVTAGIVHSFNNIFNCIWGNFELLEEEIPHNIISAECKEYLNNIRKGLDDAVNLAQEILSYTRELDNKIPLDLTKLIKSVYKIYKPILPSNIKFTLDIPDIPIQIEGNQSQLAQAIMNLLQNSVDAMPEGGELLVKLSILKEFPKNLKKSNFEKIKDKKFIEIIIKDTGIGMKEHTLQRIFTPLFTTKPAPKGTGLGLSYTLAVIEKHKGIIKVQSKFGKGTTFYIYLPYKEIKKDENYITIISNNNSKNK